MDEILAYARQLSDRYRITGRAHYLAHDRYARRHKWFGLPAAILSGAVGATLVATFRGNPDPYIQLGAGFISIVGGILSTFQTFYNFSALAERHKVAAVQYMAMRRRLDLMILFQEPRDGASRTALEELKSIHDDLDDLGKNSPPIPDADWDKARTDFDREKQYAAGPHPVSGGTRRDFQYPTGSSKAQSAATAIDSEN